MKISPLAGKLAPQTMLVNVPRLVSAYYTDIPDPALAEQRVAFGTSGHRGSSIRTSFNEWHVLAISQAICEYRLKQGIQGPLFLGIDTHALSIPAYMSAIEVLAANGVEIMLAQDDEFTPTPAVSLAILQHNRGRTNALADGIVITPSHNPPEDGGIKYNPPHGGPADTKVTSWIESRANELLSTNLSGIKRVPVKKALCANTTHRYDYKNAYAAELEHIINLEIIRSENIRLSVDPLGGAGVHYWEVIGERYRLDLNIISNVVDPTFRFMTVDWDGKIRMDPSSPYAMQRLINLQGDDDIAFACDTDHDRYGIVTQSGGLLPTNHYLAAAIHYLFQHRPGWHAGIGVGKSVVCSQIIDRICSHLGRKLVEVPVGFKWFSEDLYNATLGICGEESAGASFLRHDGSVWTTDKDGMVMALLSAEMTAVNGCDPAVTYGVLAGKFGAPVMTRVEAEATPAQKKILSTMSAQQVKCSDLAGEKIQQIMTKAPSNQASIGGVKVITENGWFMARPSGTEDIYKIYAESFLGEDHLQRIVTEAQAIVDDALAGGQGGS